MPRNADQTRFQLIRSAERLFAEHGLAAASLREINREAGQRNASALQYHFRDRRGLIRAVLARHDRDVEAARHRLLDALERDPHPDRRDVVAALVRPAADKLDDPDGGREYLRIMAEWMNRPEPRFDAATLDDPTTSLNRWRAVATPHYPELAVDHLHRRFTALRILFVELGRRAAAPPRDDRLFVSHLIDLIGGVLDTPLSAETRALLGER